jgi:hypothetical protein
MMFLTFKEGKNLITGFTLKWKRYSLQKSANLKVVF